MSETAPQDNWLKSRNLPRLGFAVAAAPPVAGALMALVLAFTVFNAQIFLTPGPTGSGQMVGAGIPQIIGNLFQAVTGGLILGALIGWPVMLVVGLPAHALLLRKTPATVWIYLGAGAAAGLAGAAARLFSPQKTAMSNEQLLQILAIGAFAGTLTAFVFWYLRRPDKDAGEYKT
jgi:hypothetical protein